MLTSLNGVAASSANRNCSVDRSTEVPLTCRMAVRMASLIASARLLPAPGARVACVSTLPTSRPATIGAGAGEGAATTATAALAGADAAGGAAGAAPLSHATSARLADATIQDRCFIGWPSSAHNAAVASAGTGMSLLFAYDTALLSVSDRFFTWPGVLVTM